jgi:hypothetical protein
MVLLFCIPLGLGATLVTRAQLLTTKVCVRSWGRHCRILLNKVVLHEVFVYAFGFLYHPLVELSSCWAAKRVMSLTNQHIVAGSVLG